MLETKHLRSRYKPTEQSGRSLPSLLDELVLGGAVNARLLVGLLSSD